MKCPECNGLRYREYESGTIRVPCGVCGVTGEVDDDSGESGIIIGTIEELPEDWVDKGECIGGFLDDSSRTEFPQMGGGGTIIGAVGGPEYLIIPEPMRGKTIDETADIAREIIKVSKDDSSSGTERDNQHTGSTDTGESAKPKKPKAKRKAGARAG